MAPVKIYLDELPDLEARLERVQNVSNKLIRLPDDHYAPQGSALADIEWYSLAAIKKTASQTEAFCALVRAKNTLSATATVRLQLDTAMRMFGLTLIRDVETAGTRLMNGESYRRLSARDGKTKLTDAYLHAELNKLHPWVSQLYEDTSAYVHLSGAHIKTGLVALPGGLFFHLNGVDEKRDTTDYHDLADTFYICSKLTSDLIGDFLATRPDPDFRAVALRKFRDAQHIE